MHHTTVYSTPTLYAGWPANNGVWSWDAPGRPTEILVGFTTGRYQVAPGHSILPPYQRPMARSQDGGETWVTELPSVFQVNTQALCVLEDPIDFMQKDLAVRVFSTGYHGADYPASGFFFSRDRGRRWVGMIPFAGLESEPELAGWELTGRTAYLPLEARRALFFLSARHPGGGASNASGWGSDRVFCAETGDGGISFQFRSWMVGPEDPYRAVMPAVARLPSGALVSAVRRRDMALPVGWIDVFTSPDAGRHWTHAARAAETGKDNGNPPALVSLKDGRVVCVCGNRSRRQMLIVTSHDGGTSWGAPAVLHEGYASYKEDADFGYPRLVQRSDGKLVAIYYWADARQPWQHIRASIWDAAES